MPMSMPTGVTNSRAVVTVFVNGKKYQGSYELEAFRTVIDAEISGKPLKQ